MILEPYLLASIFKRTNTLLEVRNMLRKTDFQENTSDFQRCRVISKKTRNSDFLEKLLYFKQILSG